MALLCPHCCIQGAILFLPFSRISKTKQADLGQPVAASAFRLPCLNLSILGTGKILSKGINAVIRDTQLVGTIDVLDAIEDEYGGVVVDPTFLPNTSNAFSASLQASLSYCSQQGKRGVWLKILEGQADLVPIAIKNQGVRAFVINEKREILVVKERKCPSHCLGIWKIPTDFIDKFEDLLSGVVREVGEETGIKSSFLDVVAFRHAHQVTFDKSDILFVCALKPLSFDISIDESEIEAARWMPLDEFINQPYHQEGQMCKTIIEMCIARYQKRYTGFSAHQVMSKLDNTVAYLYFRDTGEAIGHVPTVGITLTN